MRIKVHCVGIVDYATRLQAVLVADVKAGKGQSARYVLLTSEQRSALTTMSRPRDYSAIVRYPPAGDQGFGPGAVRTHAFDAAGNLSDGKPLHERRADSWHGAEDLWVRVDIANLIISDFLQWRHDTKPRKGCIWAPDWHVMVAVQACALACALPMPLTDRNPADVAV